MNDSYHLVDDLFDALTLLNVLAVLIITAILMYVAVSHRGRRGGVTREAYQWFLIPLTIGSIAWSIEWCLRLHTPLQELVRQIGPTRADYVLNSVVSWCFLLAGCNLFSFKERIHPDLAKETPRALRMHGFASVLGRKELPWIALTVLIVVLWFSLLNVEAQSAAHSQAVVAAVGLFVFGCGLLFTLTRERPEFVSGICSATILLYAVLQLLTSSQDLIWRYWAATLALILKITFLVAVSSFVTMIRYSRDVRQRERVAARRERAIYTHALEKARAGVLIEFHRIVGQRIAQIMLTSQTLQHDLREMIPIDNYHNVSGQLDDIVTGGSAIRDYMGRLSYKTSLQQLTFDDVRGLLRRLEEQHIRVSEEIDESIPLTSEERSAAAEIAFEAVTNVEKHAEARTVSVSLKLRAGEAVLIVNDDGIGLERSTRAKDPGLPIGGDFVKPADKRTGYGVDAMRWASRVVGGNIIITSTDEGTNVEVSFAARSMRCR